MSSVAALYRKYQDICIDRGVFAKGRSELHHYDEGEWLTYAIHLIAALPSQAERKQTETPDEPFKTPGNI